jgi:hypothetical protein
MEEKFENINAEVKIKLHGSQKFENFWYHYKWHTIVSVFVVIALTILTLQFCTKTDYDLHIIYAGEKVIGMTSLSGNGSSEYTELVSALESVAESADFEEKVNINLQNLRILSLKELEEATSGSVDPMEKARLETEIQNNTDTLYNSIMFGEYYLCFLSEDVFLSYESLYESSVFASIAPYEKEGGEYAYASERGIYLSSLGIYELPEIKKLPADTVVCIRLPGVLGAKDNGRVYADAEKMLKAILAYGE